MKLVYIEWGDALANANWFTTEEAVRWAEESSWLIREVGWVMKETRDYIVLASTWKPEDDWTEEQVKLLQKIPKTWVKTRVELSKYIKPKHSSKVS